MPLHLSSSCNSDSGGFKFLHKFLRSPNLNRSYEGPLALPREVIGSKSMKSIIVARSESQDNETDVELPSSPNHQEVLARWKPDDPRRPDIGEAPVFYPSLEEFEDTLAYIKKIRPLAEPFGICRIVPPSDWSPPPCRLKEQSIWKNTKFPTRIQNVEVLQNRDPMTKKKKPKGRKNKRKRNTRMASSDNPSEDKKFGFNSGSDFTLEEFEKYNKNFKDSYFQRTTTPGYTNWAPSIQEIEGEYWRIIEEPTDDVEVCYGADLEKQVLGSGFITEEMPNARSDVHKYIASGWNLNNLPRLPGSLLAYEPSDISGVVVPWLYVGMCFSSFCWHVEDHHLYSVNYLHFGEPKVWYGVPGSHATGLENAMRKHLPELFEEQPDLLHGLVTQFSPKILRDEGVPVYRLVQNAGDYVVTFPRAYHAGFNSGFNCAEAVNFAPLDWLPHGQNAVEIYSNEARKTSLSHDKLLLGAIMEPLESILRERTILRWKSFCAKNEELTKALETRLGIEEGRIKALGEGLCFQEMDKDFDSDCERECISCLSDLHLSASGCNKCFPGGYACTKHLKNLCSCEGKDRFVLLRYTIDELSSLVRALQGRSAHLHIWIYKIMEILKDKSKKRQKLSIDLNIEYTMEDDELKSFSETLDDESMKIFVAEVEPINFGSLVIRKLWCHKQTIYPKEFKSRVRFYNVQDPRKMSNYISEIVDAGLLGPLFKVTLEESPDESFISTSVQRCWEMVLERLNEEIEKLSSKEPNLHTLESINGEQMFGFLSPSIIQATEALDPDHRLVEYWKHINGSNSLEIEDSST